MGRGTVAGETLAERFWRQIDKNGPVPAHKPELGNCWIWTGSTYKETGYGRVSFEWKTVKTHRLGWMLANGEIPQGGLICHHCDNPPCARASHLFLGDSSTNNHDMMNKERHTHGEAHWTRQHPERVRKGTETTAHLVRHGEAHGRAKLTDAQVLAIRSEYQPWRISYTKLASKYGVSSKQIRNIIYRLGWTHI